MGGQEDTLGNGVEDAAKDNAAAAPSSLRLAMAEPFADWPKDEVAATDDRPTLMAFLDYLRAVLARKAAGLSDEQARMAACLRAISRSWGSFGTWPRWSAAGRNDR